MQLLSDTAAQITATPDDNRMAHHQTEPLLINLQHITSVPPDIAETILHSKEVYCIPNNRSRGKNWLQVKSYSANTIPTKILLNSLNML